MTAKTVPPATRSPARRAAPIIEVRRQVQEGKSWTYADLDLRQREVAELVRAGHGGAILLSEVAPVITVGRRTAAGDLLIAEEELKNLGVGIYPTDRGGFASYHGPGQWVLFVIDQLENLTGDRKGVRNFVEQMLQIAAQVLRSYGYDPRIGTGTETGVWCGPAKYAALGIHIERGVVLHGIAINGFRTDTSFVGLRPCGLDAPIGFVLQDQPNLAADPALDGRLEGEFEELGKKIIMHTKVAFWPFSLD